MNMEQYENRFGYYREKTTEELEETIIELENDRRAWESIFEDKKSISEQKTDAWNEMKYIDDQLLYLDVLMKERKGNTR